MWLANMLASDVRVFTFTGERPMQSFNDFSSPCRPMPVGYAPAAITCAPRLGEGDAVTPRAASPDSSFIEDEVSTEIVHVPGGTAYQIVGDTEHLVGWQLASLRDQAELCHGSWHIHSKGPLVVPLPDGSVVWAARLFVEVIR